MPAERLRATTGLCRIVNRKKRPKASSQRKRLHDFSLSHSSLTTGHFEPVLLEQGDRLRAFQICNKSLGGLFVLR